MQAGGVSWQSQERRAKGTSGTRCHRVHCPKGGGYLTPLHNFKLFDSNRQMQTHNFEVEAVVVAVEAICL